MIYNRANVRHGARVTAGRGVGTFSLAVNNNYRGGLYFLMCDTPAAETLGLVGRQYGSLSAAGKAITGRETNGWAFWSIEGGESSNDRLVARSINQTNRTRSRRGIGRSTGNGPRRYGIEIEFIGDRTAVCQALHAAGIAAHMDVYNHVDSATSWKVTTDGSVHGGGELVSPILQGDAGFEQIRKVGEALDAAGASVNKATGLHVHHDARDLSLDEIKRIFSWVVANQNVMDGLVAPSRRGNTYCRHLNEMDAARLAQVADARNLCSMDRYRNLNVAAYARHGTLEFRQHQGTVNATKMVAWVKLTGSIIEQAKAESTPSIYRDIAGLLNGLRGLSDDLRTFFNARAANFAAEAMRI